MFPMKAWVEIQNNSTPLCWTYMEGLRALLGRDDIIINNQYLNESGDSDFLRYSSQLISSNHTYTYIYGIE